MPFNSSGYLAWQQAEQRAAAAEKQLFAKLSSLSPESLPSREEVEQTRVLREEANQLLQQMVQDMARIAASLKQSAAQRRHEGRRSAGGDVLHGDRRN
jgi:hypothetical protein